MRDSESFDVQLIYMTASSREEARKIIEALLEQKLIACANILPAVESLYVWDGKLQNTQEVVVIMKSSSAAFSRLKETVLDLHSYSCPCLVALPLNVRHSEFLRWIQDSTSF